MSKQPADSKATLVPFECRPPIEQSLINDFNRLQSKYDSLVNELENLTGHSFYWLDGQHKVFNSEHLEEILQKHSRK